MQGDFIGFSFDGVHSSRLGLIRVSDGDRYNDILHPNFEDKLLSIPGGDGQYYYGSNYTERRITISVAFDSITEEQLRQIVRLFSTKDPCPLIFDERPYKVYTAKIGAPIQLNYVCFDAPVKTEYGKNKVAPKLSEYEGATKTGVRLKSEKEKYRVYKGDGSIEFVCTSLYAYAPFKTLDAYKLGESKGGYSITTYSNVNEWAKASGILSAATYNSWKIDKPQPLTVNGTIKWKCKIAVYNPGDVDAPFQLYLPFSSSGVIKGQDNKEIKILVGNEWMYLSEIKRKDSRDSGILINTENHLIEGVSFSKEQDVWLRTGTVYNQYLIAGNFPKILHEDLFLDMVETKDDSGSIRPKQDIWIDYNGTYDKVRIYYNYLYY